MKVWKVELPWGKFFRIRCESNIDLLLINSINTKLLDTLVTHTSVIEEDCFGVDGVNESSYLYELIEKTLNLGNPTNPPSRSFKKGKRIENKEGL